MMPGSRRARCSWWPAAASPTRSRPRACIATRAAATVQLWELPDTGHTAGLRKHPAAYERRTVGFLDRALGVGYGRRPSRAARRDRRRFAPSGGCGRTRHRSARPTRRELQPPAPRPPRWRPGSGPRRARTRRCRTAGRSSASTRPRARASVGRRRRARARPGARGRARSAGERVPSASSSTAAARRGHAPRGPAPGRGQRDARRARVGALAPADVAGRHEPVDEPHGARRRQAQDAPQAVDRAAVGEVLERRQRRGRRQGLIGGRGDGVGHLVGDDERQRAEDVAVAAQRGHRGYSKS